jgi:hypothetical protein
MKWVTHLWDVFLVSFFSSSWKHCFNYSFHLVYVTSIRQSIKRPEIFHRLLHSLLSYDVKKKKKMSNEEKSNKCIDEYFLMQHVNIERINNKKKMSNWSEKWDGTLVDMHFYVRLINRLTEKFNIYAALDLMSGWILVLKFRHPLIREEDI